MQPNAYRGIALESNALKLITRVLAKGVASILDPALAEEQFGYRPRRSIHIACSRKPSATHQDRTRKTKV